MVGEHSRQMKTQICTVRDIGIRRRWISLITNPLNCWAPVPYHKYIIHNRGNLGQISGAYPIYRQNLGRSEKSKIPDRLGFSRHMKTRLNYLVNLQFVWDCFARAFCCVMSPQEWVRVVALPHAVLELCLD